MNTCKTLFAAFLAALALSSTFNCAEARPVDGAVPAHKMAPVPAPRPLHAAGDKIIVVHAAPSPAPRLHRYAPDKPAPRPLPRR